MTLLKAGDRAGYVAMCANPRRFEHLDLSNPNHKAMLAWTFALGPGALDDYAYPIGLIEPIAQSKIPVPLPAVALGVLLYRAGKYTEAIDALEKAHVFWPKKGSPHAWVFQAMALERLGRRDEAIKRFEAFKVAKLDVPQSQNDSWKIELDLFHREAETLLFGTLLPPGLPFVRERR